MRDKAQFRPHRRVMAHADSRQEIVASAGSQSDPVVVDAFLECEVDFEEVASRFADR
jgi:response regulator RpfG family c-di-GMP phosphodiesterase